MLIVKMLIVKVMLIIKMMVLIKMTTLLKESQSIPVLFHTTSSQVKQPSLGLAYTPTTVRQENLMEKKLTNHYEFVKI